MEMGGTAWAAGGHVREGDGALASACTSFRRCRQERGREPGTLPRMSREKISILRLVRSTILYELGADDLDRRRANVDKTRVIR